MPMLVSGENVECNSRRNVRCLSLMASGHPCANIGCVCVRFAHLQDQSEHIMGADRDRICHTLYRQNMANNPIESDRSTLAAVYVMLCGRFASFIIALTAAKNKHRIGHIQHTVAYIINPRVCVCVCLHAHRLFFHLRFFLSALRATMMCCLFAAVLSISKPNEPFNRDDNSVQTTAKRRPSSEKTK